MNVAAMPAVCRAEYNPGTASTRKIESPRNLLAHFLNTFCDALARAWGKSAAPKFTRGDDPPTRAWLEALFAESPVIHLLPNQMQGLAASQRAWMRNLHVAGDAAFRIAFRLESPALPNQPWQLHYLIQARDDPSLLIPAEEVWKKTASALTHLGRRFEQPQEKLLAGLGYAARLFPPLAGSLKNKAPTGLAVDSGGAYTFLRASAPLEGFSVSIRPPAIEMPLLKRLGEANFVPAPGLESLLGPAYREIGKNALETAYQEDGEKAGQEEIL